MLTAAKLFIGRLVPSKVWLWGALAAMGAFLLALARKDARDDVKSDINEDRIERMEEGNATVQKEREETDGASNSDLVDRLRRRDSDWGRM